MKLEPTAEQLELIAKAAGMAVWEMQIAFDIANHGIPEGAPVGTISRRPDGAWKAERKAGEAGPYWQYSTSAFWQADSPDWNGEDDADSWPVIYDPRECEALSQAEPCQSIDPVSELKCSQTLGHEGNHGTCSGLEWPDPTAQQEPGESLARGLDDLAAGRVSRRDDYLEPQPEPKLCSGCYQCQAPKPPRTPRVVDRLGVDEQGSRWRDENGLIHSFTEGADGGRWKTQIGGSWYPWAKGVVPHGGEYTEIVEPRVLPSLDCEEARDGTIWECTKYGVAHRVQFLGEQWVCLSCDLALIGSELTAWSPYTEVLS